MGAHQSVGSVTGAMMPCWARRSISALSLSLYAKGMVCGVFTEGAGILSKFYVEFFTRHYPYLAIKHAWELRHDLVPGDICVG